MSGNVSEIIVLVIGLAFKGTDNKSVYPMSPVQILVLNMLTSSPPALGLGMEPPVNDIMFVPPRDSTKIGSGLFTKELMLDIGVYGSLMGGLTLSVWSVSLYALWDSPRSPLGAGCNEISHTGSPIPVGCEGVFRARGASYICLNALLLIHAFNCRSLRYSIFVGKKYGGVKNLYKNRFLFWSVAIGFIMAVATLYIP